MSDLYERSNPHRLYRDRENAMIAGVCAGIAEYFGFNRKGVRAVTAAGAIFFMPFTVISYVILAIVLPVRPAEPKWMKKRKISGAVSAMRLPMFSAVSNIASANSIFDCSAWRPSSLRANSRSTGSWAGPALRTGKHQGGARF